MSVLYYDDVVYIYRSCLKRDKKYETQNYSILCGHSFYINSNG
jgi:hypothetical protein